MLQNPMVMQQMRVMMQDPAVKQRMQKMLSKLGADSGVDPKKLLATCPEYFTYSWCRLQVLFEADSLLDACPS